MNYAIVLAGGVGSRFWPLSTNSKPKQFLSLCSDKPLLLESIERISSLVSKQNIYIATNKTYKKTIQQCLKNTKVPLKNILFEPQSKNTLAAIAVLSKEIYQIDKNAVVVVLPSDHLIKNKIAFQRTIKNAIKAAENNFIVTLGIVPKRPEGGFGYIKIKDRLKIKNINAYRVDKFIEKPGLAKAINLIKNKRFYWNSGIFIFKASKFLDEINKLTPKVFKIIEKIKNKNDLNKFWFKFPNISIDYAIMEKAKSLSLIPLACGWSDLGSWQAVEEFMRKDQDGNISQGKHIDLGSKNIIVWAKEKLIATVGLDNIIIVDTKDGLLVCDKNKTQEVREIVKRIKEKAR
jgi:mannose-1-phosphate guanylyltransferase